MGYQVGDKVHVEFDAVITEAGNTGSGRRFTNTLREIDTGSDTGPVHYVYLHEEIATVTEPVTPQSWPPKAGDIWEAAGIEYFVYAGLLGLTVFPFDGAVNGRDSYSASTFDEFKKLKPKLVRRAMTVTEWNVNIQGSGLGDYFSDYFSHADNFR
jgi:hypothetical protein